MTSKEILNKFFGYDNFRPGQEEIINHILSKQDCLGIMPTSAGKSICYQIPALIFSGITIVISPLISLMKDQVDSLIQKNIPAVYLNSTLSYQDRKTTLKNIIQNKYKIIYISPERLQTDEFQLLCTKLNISMIAIDEAHCVSQWGHDFRPSYLQISGILPILPTRPVLVAFTATATPLVKSDILKFLNLQNPFILTTGFNRTNLTFKIETPYNKKEYIVNYLKKHICDCGIIYCSTKKYVDKLHYDLELLGFAVSKYHGGMLEDERNENQNNFLSNQTNIMIATNAFGMGVNKSNVRFVIHYNFSKDLEGYYQEAGRAGRDGKESECILLFSYSDITTNKILIDKSTSKEQKIFDNIKLQDMVKYCTTPLCLKKYILNYFGETPEFENCQKCSNCMTTNQKENFTIEAKKIISCIKRMHERYGINLIISVLKGSKSSKIKALGFDKLSTYGIMANYSSEKIKNYIYQLIKQNYLKYINTKYPIITLTKKSNDILFFNKEVFF